MRTNSIEIPKCISIFPDSHLALAGSLLKRCSKEKRAHFRAGLRHDDVSKPSETARPSPRVNVTADLRAESLLAFLSNVGEGEHLRKDARTLQTREAVAKLAVFEFESAEVFQAFFFFTL